MSWILEVEGLKHRLWDPQRGQEFVVTVEMRLSLPAGGFAAILGPNACGKTTLLSVLGLLRKPTDLDHLKTFRMRVQEGGVPTTYDLKEEWRQQARVERLRRRHVGFALQSGELLPALTVRENIGLPLRLNGYGAGEFNDRINGLIRGFGLLKGSDGNRLAESRVNTISGGEYQRVALARAIAHRPALVFVDEPTASLNRATAREALGQLRNLQVESGGRTTVLMITHDETLAREFADLIILMRAVTATAGEVAEVVVNRPTAQPAASPRGETVS